MQGAHAEDPRVQKHPQSGISHSEDWEKNQQAKNRVKAQHKEQEKNNKSRNKSKKITKPNQ